MQTSAPSGAPAPLMSHRQILFVIFGLMAGMFLSALDQTVVGTSKNCAHWIIADLAIWMAGHASVTEDFTGTIADSINYSVDQLRDLVATINLTALMLGIGAARQQNPAVDTPDDRCCYMNSFHRTISSESV